MSPYLVERPCAVNNANGSVRVHGEPGNVVELSDEQAATLGDAVRALGHAAAEPQEEPEQPARSARGRGRRQQPAEEAEQARGAVVSPFDAPEEPPGDE